MKTQKPQPQKITVPENITSQQLKARLGELSIREKQLTYGLQQVQAQYNETFQQLQALESQNQAKLAAAAEQATKQKEQEKKG